jgi:hypothetical protein
VAELDCDDTWRLLCREYVNRFDDVVEVVVEDFADAVEVALVTDVVVLGFDVAVEEVLSVVEVDLGDVDDVDSVDLIEVEERIDVEDVCDETLDEEDFSDVVEDMVAFEVDAG